MKTQQTLCFLVITFFACKNDPSSPSEPAYDCEITKNQLLSIDTLVGDMQTLDPWGDDLALDSIAAFNAQIEQELTSLLTCAAVANIDFNSETFQNLYYAQTPDGRIRNFYWYANNGGTWQEMRRIYQYYPEPLMAKTSSVDYFAGATRFYELKSEKPLYLGFGADKTCSTCIVEYAHLFSFTADTLQIETVVTLESRMGDLIKFDFDPASQTLKYIMIIDDLNEDQTRDLPKQKLGDLNIQLGEEYEGYEPDPASEVVVGSFVFDGKRFVEN